jgi:hypothetical protein
VSTPVGEAIRILGIYTAGRFDIWMLAGSQKASARQHVLSVLLAKSVPKSKAGVNALRDAFYAAGNITGEYEAQRERNFLEWIKSEGGGE